MSRVLALALVAGLLLPVAARAAEVRYSGRISSAPGSELTLEEIGSWKPGSHPITRVIPLGPSTRVERVTRVATAGPGRWPGGFEAKPLAASALRPGEFATVAVERRGGKLVALSVTVVNAP